MMIPDHEDLPMGLRHHPRFSAMACFENDKVVQFYCHTEEELKRIVGLIRNDVPVMTQQW